jgi:hypothetical protein
MGKIPCKIFDQPIDETRCYLKTDLMNYLTNSSCKECPQYSIQFEKLRDLMNKARGIEEDAEVQEKKPSRLILKDDLLESFSTSNKLHSREDGNGGILNGIENDIPVVLNHSSFYEDRRFLRWQLVRLNKNYISDYMMIEEKFFISFLLQGHCKPPFRCAKLMEDKKYLDYLKRAMLLQKGVPWEKMPRLNCGHGKGVCWVYPFFLGLWVSLNIDLPPIGNETKFEDWDEPRSTFFQETLIFAVLPGVEYPPMRVAPTIRFPSALEAFPEFSGYKKRSALNWARILLELELYQAGMPKVDIAHRLEGLEIGKPSNEGWRKAPEYDRVQKNINYAIQAVNEAYPFSPPDVG